MSAGLFSSHIARCLFALPVVYLIPLLSHAEASLSGRPRLSRTILAPDLR
jgi:hypothetical protein